MKQIFATIAAASLFLGSVTSCSKMLDIPQHGVLNTDNFYQTDEDALSAVTAIYAEFEDLFIFKEFEMSYNWLNSYLSDEFWHGQSDRAVDLEMLESFTFDADYPTIETVFTSLYNVIGKCNVVLDNVQGESDIQQQARAEAKVFRAWMYFELTTLWGNPPLVDHVLNPDEASVPNADPADLWKLMETDLTEAVNSGKLVSKAGVYDKTNYRVTKEYAEALLGKVYLWQGKNKEAAESLQKVIDSQKYDLFRGQYGDMFNGENQNNEEVVFSTHFLEDLQNPVVRLWPSSTGLSAYSRDGLNFTAGEPNELKVSELSKVNLLSIRKWTKFLAIVGLVVIILVAVAILALPFFAREYPQAAGLFIYCIFILALYIYPLMKMFGIVKALKPAVEQCDEQQLDKAVSETKALVTFMGVLTIVVLALYALALLFAGSLLASLS